MVKGFEEITYEVTDNERKLAKQIWRILQSRQGEYVTNDQLQELLGKKVGNARIRKIIQHIRKVAASNTVQKPMPAVIGNKNGYMMTRDLQMQHDHIISLAQKISALQTSLRAADIIYRRQLELENKAYQLSIYAELGIDAEEE